jgi:peptidylprolyl isomerase
MTSVGPASVVVLHYTGKLADGTVFDSSSGKEPLTVEMAKHMVISGFEKALLGMSAGEKKTAIIKAEDGYPYHNELVVKLPRNTLPKDLDIKVGATLALRAPTGQRIPGVVKETSGDEVTIDLNFPLAGKELTFEIEILKINEAASATPNPDA